MEKNIEERLASMKERFVEAFPQGEESVKNQLDAFAKMDDKQREAKLLEMIDLLEEKQDLLAEKYMLSADAREKSEIKSHQEAIAEKLGHMKDKLELIRSGKFDMAKMEKMKRQLANLELKRCKNRLGRKDCSKIDEKIAQKKALFKQSFNS